MNGKKRAGTTLFAVETRLPEEAKARLEQLAATNLRSVSAEVRLAIEQHLDRAA